MSNYRKGRRFEYRVRDHLESRGWVVLRCSRSRPFDLVALKEGMILLIECKLNGRACGAQRRMQEELASRAGALYVFIDGGPGWRERLDLLLREVERAWRRGSSISPGTSPPLPGGSPSPGRSSSSRASSGPATP